MASLTNLVFSVVICLASTAHVQLRDDPGAETRIQTGKIVKNYPPFAVAIKHKGHVEVKCSASLISPDRVLTAAHCKTSKLAQVVLGMLNVETESVEANLNNPNVSVVEFEVEDFIQHPNYIKRGSDNENETHNSYHDIAVIKLKQPVKPIFKPILLASVEDYFSVFLKSFGWGMHTCDPNEYDELREADGQYYGHCQEGFGEKTQVCAKFTVGGKPATTASGDSGGPLVSLRDPYNPVQLGLCEGGNWAEGSGGEGQPKCADKTRPQRFSSIPYFKKFILENAPNAKFLG